MNPLTLALDDNTAKVLLALIGVVPSSLAALLAFLIRREVRTPSGEKIGAMAERTHDLTAANTAMLTYVHKQARADARDPQARTRKDD